MKIGDMFKIVLSIAGLVSVYCAHNPNQSVYEVTINDEVQEFDSKYDYLNFLIESTPDTMFTETNDSCTKKAYGVEILNVFGDNCKDYPSFLIEHIDSTIFNETFDMGCDFNCKIVFGKKIENDKIEVGTGFYTYNDYSEYYIVDGNSDSMKRIEGNTCDRFCIEFKNSTGNSGVIRREYGTTLELDDKKFNLLKEDHEKIVDKAIDDLEEHLGIRTEEHE